jgi:hypothetical protein
LIADWKEYVAAHPEISEFSIYIYIYIGSVCISAGVLHYHLRVKNETSRGESIFVMALRLCETTEGKYP